MKAVQKYQCEFCHTEYATKEDAVSCEKNHKTPESMEARYQPKAMNGSGYPVSVTVRMSDGKELVYKR